MHNVQCWYKRALFVFYFACVFSVEWVYYYPIKV